MSIFAAIQKIPYEMIGTITIDFTTKRRKSFPALVPSGSFLLPSPLHPGTAQTASEAETVPPLVASEGHPPDRSGFATVELCLESASTATEEFDSESPTSDTPDIPGFASVPRLTVPPRHLPQCSIYSLHQN